MTWRYRHTRSQGFAAVHQLFPSLGDLDVERREGYKHVQRGDKDLLATPWRKELYKRRTSPQHLGQLCLVRFDNLAIGIRPSGRL